MTKPETVIGIFDSHQDAEAAIKKLSAGGFDIKDLSVVGKGYHTEEQVQGFYNIGDRVMFWGTRGAFWGALWGLFFGGIFITLPFTGPVIVLGSLAAMVISTVEGAVIAGGLSAMGAALYSIGIPQDSVIAYEAALKADGFLVMAHGNSAKIATAKDILATANARQIEVHDAPPPARPVATAA
jgi:Protein of unknown function (DUF3341)